MCEKMQIEGVQQDEQGHGPGDRPGDPLFPLMPRMLEALRERAAKRTAERRAVAGADEAVPMSEYAALLESICGARDDSQAVEQYDGTLGVTQAFVNGRQRAVGQIQWNDNLAAVYTNPGDVSGERWCSGTLIGNDLFLTAGHCFDQTGGGWQRPRVNGTANIIPSAEIAANMHVNFNFQDDPAGNPRPVSAFPITALLEYRLGGLDFAIVRLGGNPGATWGRGTISTTDAVAGDMLCIIGHPAGVPKRIEAGPALAPQGNFIRYDDIDTLGGNSGSGVLRASDGQIVGVHTNGGCVRASPDGANANLGMRIAAVIAASPTLQTMTRPSTKRLDDQPFFTTKRTDDQVFTSRLRDDLVTSRWLDVGATIRGLDDPITNPRWDQLGTRKGLDDVKSPALDKGWSDVKMPGFDGQPPWDPGRWAGGGGGFGGGRPFALMTPHHTMGWGGEASAHAAAHEDAERYESALSQLDEAIAQQQQLLAEMAAEYGALQAEYRQAMGQAPGQGPGRG